MEKLKKKQVEKKKDDKSGSKSYISKSIVFRQYRNPVVKSEILTVVVEV